MPFFFAFFIEFGFSDGQIESATDCKPWFSARRLPQLDAVAVEIGDPAKAAEVVLLDLFGGRIDYMTHHWPRWKAPGASGGEPSLNGIEPRTIAACLVNACSEIGAVEIDAHVRGRGGWLVEGRNGP